MGARISAASRRLETIRYAHAYLFLGDRPPGERAF